MAFPAASHSDSSTTLPYPLMATKHKIVVNPSVPHARAIIEKVTCGGLPEESTTTVYKGRRNTLVDINCSDGAIDNSTGMHINVKAFRIPPFQTISSTAVSGIAKHNAPITMRLNCSGRGSTLPCRWATANAAKESGHSENMASGPG